MVGAEDSDSRHLYTWRGYTLRLTASSSKKTERNKGGRAYSNAAGFEADRALSECAFQTYIRFTTNDVIVTLSVRTLSCRLMSLNTGV